jgi:starch synthase
VRATGGLDDTIEDYTPRTESGNGFKFNKYTPHQFLDKIKAALKVYEQKDAWLRLVKKGMALDFSWENSARQYLQLYQSACGKKGYPPFLKSLLDLSPQI